MIESLKQLRQRARQLFRAREDAVFFALCAFVGVAGCLVGAAFRFAADQAQQLVGGGGTVREAMEHLSPVGRVALPVIGGLLAGLVMHLMRGDGGAHGVPEVMEVVVLGRQTLRVRAALKKSLASFIGIVSGGSLGREGPIIQLATTIAARTSTELRLSDQSYRTLTAAGVAAGVAAAYHTPLAATLFVIEVIVGTMNMRALGAAVIAAFSATVTSDTLFPGLHPSFKLSDWHGGSAPEYAASIILGILAGVVGVAFIKLLKVGGRAFTATRLPLPLRTALGGLIVGLIGMAWPEVYGNGYETAREIVASAAPGFTVATLLWLLVAKAAATTGSVGSGVPGGVFTPTLFLGAALGGVVGQLLHTWAPGAHASPGVFALLGMGGALAATMHAPLLATVMVVELSGELRMALPLLLLTVIARTMARAISRESIYTSELRNKGVETEGTLEARVLGSLKVRDLVRTDVALVSQTMTLPEIVERFSRSRELFLYVGDPNDRLVGAIDLHDVKGAFENTELGSLVIAQDLARPIPVAFPGEAIADVNRRLWLQDVGHLPVVTSAEDPHWMGVLTRRDILGAVDREILSRNGMLAPVKSFGAPDAHWFELPPGGQMETVRLPSGLSGRTIRDTSLGQRHGITILAVIRRDRHGVATRELPRPDMILRDGDELLILGPEDTVAQLRAHTFDDK